jgi:hypothetical protein
VIKEQRKESRTDNLALQNEIKRHTEKIQELERVISHFNLGVIEHDTPTGSKARQSHTAIKIKMSSGSDSKPFFTPRHVHPKSDVKLNN